jgi:hypothetical protein
MKDQSRIDELESLIEAAPGELPSERVRFVARTLQVKRNTIYIWKNRLRGAEIGLRSLGFLREAVKKVCNTAQS